MIPTYGCLRGINQSGSVKVVELVESHLRRLLLTVLKSVDVDEEYYRSTNRDVDEKIHSGEIPSARSHYILAGYYEDRLPRAVIVNEAWYLSQYPDVADAVSRRSFSSASHHFALEGFREGRLPYDGWSLVADKPA